MFFTKESYQYIIFLEIHNSLNIYLDNMMNEKIDVFVFYSINTTYRTLIPTQNRLTFYLVTLNLFTNTYILSGKE